MRTAFVSSLLLASAASAAELPALAMKAQTIDPAIQIGYGLAIADVDGDKKDDIVLCDAKQIVWYKNPTWQKFVIAENLTAKDHVSVAARDVDGDGKAEIAVGAEWNPGDTVNSGAVFLLEAPADRTQKWTPKQLKPYEPTTHRMGWVRGPDRGFYLAVQPLHGRGNKANAGVGVEFLGYEYPWTAASKPVPLAASLPPLHATHNFDVGAAVRPDAGEYLLLATKEGVRAIDTVAVRATPQVITTIAAGEVRAGSLPSGGRFIATVEPMHGNELAVYRAPATPASSTSDWTASRVSLDDKLVQGHALATADLLGVGSDQVIVGWRGGNTPGAKVGIKVYAASDATGSAWKMHALVDDNTMACEDLKVADLNGDGKPEIIAAGRATKNVIIYWNETQGTRSGAKK
ncbi:MAG: FG-GAP and VCBS repeat-containing protein [Verrucomicrobiota bacterium]